MEKAAKAKVKRGACIRFATPREHKAGDRPIEERFHGGSSNSIATSPRRTMTPKVPGVAVRYAATTAMNQHADVN
jgi:hypothetical protein